MRRRKVGHGYTYMLSEITMPCLSFRSRINGMEGGNGYINIKYGPAVRIIGGHSTETKKQGQHEPSNKIVKILG